LKVATVRFFALNRSIVTDIIPATFLEPEWKISAFHSIKAVVSQVGAYVKYIIATHLVKMKATPKPLRATRIFGC